MTEQLKDAFIDAHEKLRKLASQQHSHDTRTEIDLGSGWTWIPSGRVERTTESGKTIQIIPWLGENPNFAGMGIMAMSNELEGSHYEISMSDPETLEVGHQNGTPLEKPEVILLLSELSQVLSRRRE
jgi:hypothetical protein